MKTVMVGEPTGKFMVFDKLDLVHDAKTTKKDLDSLDGDDGTMTIA